MTDSSHSAVAETRSVQGHTPGHWHVAEDGSKPKRKFIVICDCENNHAATILAESNLPEPQRQANARLMAAAPELLEAARDALLCLTGEYDTDSAHSSAMDALRSAIAKATGSAT